MSLKEQQFAADIEAALKNATVATKPVIQGIMSNFKKKCYHDFESEEACPKLNLLQDLRHAKLESMALKVLSGAYDF
jgi:hypothetical protein